MTTDYSRDRLFDIIRGCGLGSVLNTWAPDQAAAFQTIDNVLTAFCAAYESKFENFVPPLPKPRLSKADILDEHARNPHKVSAFFQTFFAGCTPEMLVMVWRLLQGAQIANAELSYINDVPHLGSIPRSTFLMRIRLQGREHEEQPEEEYKSHSVMDISVFRHLGAMEINGWPWLGDFFPLRIQ